MSLTLEGLAALLNDRFDALTELLKTKPPAEAPPSPSGPTAAEKIAAFKTKYANRSHDEFVAKYGVAPGAKLPALPLPLNPEAVIDYARDGYDYQGAHHPGPLVLFGEGSPEAVCAAAMDEIANGRPGWWTNYGDLDPDVSAVGVKAGFFDSKGVLLFIGNSPRRPGSWRGVSFPDFVAQMPGGEAGGGPA